MKNVTNSHRYAIQYFRDQGESTSAGQVPVTVDWEQALNCVWFDAVRRDIRLPSVFSDAIGARIEPVWHRKLGQPFAEGFRVTIQVQRDLPEISQCIPTEYVKDLARQGTTALVERGEAKADETLRYLVCAFPSGSQAPDSESNMACRFTVTEMHPPLPLQDGYLQSLLAGSVPSGLVNDDAKMPVFVPQFVIREAITLTRKAGAAETGGILIGRLLREPGSPAIFVEVTAQIPARHAREELTRLTFTAETWTDVDNAIALRRKRETYLGWWHSHPAREWCKNCPPENRKTCKLSGEFFSAHDAALHRAVFPRAYSIALVISDSYATGLTWPLFGWRLGMVQNRGYHILGMEVPALAAISDASEEEHGTTNRPCNASSN